MSTPTTGRATVRYFGGAKAVAGTSSERVALLPGTSVEDLVANITAIHGDGMARVVAASSFLLDGATLDVLPPAAGG